MNVNATRFGIGLLGGSAASSALLMAKHPNTKKSEQLANNYGTALGLGIVGGTAIAGRKVLKEKPEILAKAAAKVGAGIEKAAMKVTEKAPGLINKVVSKLKTNKIGAKVLEYATKGAKKAAAFINDNKTLSKIADKAAETVKTFAKLPAAQKGKVALIGAGVALLAGTAIKLIRNHDKKSGAIDQKYKDMYKDYKHMVATHPITDAKTGEPVSFEEFCKIAQTRVY